jgi:hypothetical protein
MSPLGVGAGGKLVKGTGATTTNNNNINGMKIHLTD